MKYFSYDPTDVPELQTHATAEEAKARAEKSLDEARAWAGEGWDQVLLDNPICWGEIRQVMTQTEHRTLSAEEAQEKGYDEEIDFELKEPSNELNSQPTEKELRELKVFIIERVMGRCDHDFVISDNRCTCSKCNTAWFCDPRPFDPIKNKDDAFEVLEKCAEKQAESFDEYRPDAILCIWPPLPGEPLWTVASDPTCAICGKGNTLELAICLFAKRLFS